ncbi:MAG: glycosyltransferase [Rhizobiales bacterium]|nr:glycosyltransferase [Hyphomicrobiales bacterium]
MARITVGVPVYNGAATLRACLTCLRDQSFRDIEVLISDNCSQDDSAVIAEEFVQADPRFRLIRQRENVGARRNFASLLAAASAPLFMWRADDAISDPNYIESLQALHEREPDLVLAVGGELINNADGTLWRAVAFEPSDSPIKAIRIGREMLAAHANFIYGLWNRDYLRQAHGFVMAHYPHLWAWDHMTVLPVLLDEKIASTSDTRLISSLHETREGTRPSVPQMVAIRRSFRHVAGLFVQARRWSLADSLLMQLYVYRYANLKTFRFFKVLRRAIRDRLGMASK